MLFKLIAAKAPLFFFDMWYVDLPNHLNSSFSWKIVLSEISHTLNASIEKKKKTEDEGSNWEDVNLALYLPYLGNTVFVFIKKSHQNK